MFSHCNSVRFHFSYSNTWNRYAYLSSPTVFKFSSGHSFIQSKNTQTYYEQIFVYCRNLQLIHSVPAIRYIGKIVLYFFRLIEKTYASFHSASGFFSCSLSIQNCILNPPHNTLQIQIRHRLMHPPQFVMFPC